jgi:hypothetical protein
MNSNCKPGADVHGNLSFGTSGKKISIDATIIVTFLTIVNQQACVNTQPAALFYMEMLP